MAKPSTDRRAIEVWADWQSLTGARRMGTLHVAIARNKEVFSFEYDDEWVASPRRNSSRATVAIDPELELVRGPQHVPNGATNFGAFLDSSPDRWGRVLMQRREAQVARQTKRAERRLTELDYLLGVYDGHRMGGLRFKIDGGPFLDDNAELASPPWASLRELEQASLQLERTDVERDPQYGAWLRMLIAPGRSLGGARPKASVVDPKKHLWLAKLPSANDEYDVGGWESVVHALAVRAGIRTVEAKHQRFASPHHTFLTRRFDRTATGGRIHFASAMTLLGRRDGEASAGASYIEIAEAIIQRGASVDADLEEIWRRIAFFVCVSNVDDHLLNHGFLLDRNGWRLAPAYDMNPVPHGGGLLLNISETDNAQDLDLVRSVAPNFRVKPQRAIEVIKEVVAATRTWRDEAKKRKLSRAEQDRMASAFAYDR